MTNSLRISTRLTLVNAAIFAVLLLFVSVLTITGLYFSMYHQAEVDLVKTIALTRQTLARTEDMALEPIRHRGSKAPVFLRELFKDGAVMPGVVLRITDEDEDGELVFDPAEQYPTLKKIRKHLVKPPFWANRDMSVSIVGNYHLYVKDETVTWHGKTYGLHFFRAITAERSFLERLTKGLLLTNLIGMVVALLAGYCVSRRFLRPISAITATASAIEVSDLSRRIPEPTAKDELRRLAVTFNRMLDRLEAGFAQQRQFVADASHELRTPVTVILGYADMLSRWGKDDPDTLGEAVTDIKSEAENMRQLIERLLFLARADMNRTSVRLGTVDMQALLADIAKKSTLISSMHAVALARNDAATVMGDEVLLRQMLRVFIDNAMKYSPEGGTVTIASVADCEVGRLRVSIADEGIGIAPEHLDKVFERFFRVDSSRTKGADDGSRGARLTTGSGLGLSIAKSIADAHGIALSLDSELGRGTTVNIELEIVG